MSRIAFRLFWKVALISPTIREAIARHRSELEKFVSQTKQATKNDKQSPQRRTNVGSTVKLLWMISFRLYATKKAEIERDLKALCTKPVWHSRTLVKNFKNLFLVFGVFFCFRTPLAPVAYRGPRKWNFVDENREGVFRRRRKREHKKI